MLRSWISLAALAIVVAALVAWVYYRPQVEESESFALSQLKSAEVKRIRVERAVSAQATPPGTPDITQPASSAANPPTAHAPAPAAAIDLERIEDGWRMTAPFAARADSFEVQRLLSILEARSQARYAATDLSRYGLAEAHSKVAIDNQSFSFGAVNTMTREQYVLTNNHVYAIPLTQRTAVPRDADAMISRALLAPGEVPVRLELPDFSVALRDGVWIFTPPVENAGADERNAWIDRWRQASAVRASRHDGRRASGQIKLVLKDGSRIELGILQREPELVLVRLDENIQYHFFADAAKRLLSPLVAKSDGVK